MPHSISQLAAAILLITTYSLATAAESVAPYAIQVVDASTGRGVPLVELETINHLRFVTDSNGLAAVNEPELMNRRVYFSVSSHGYQFSKDGFGFRGKTLEIRPGGVAKLKLRRINIAERIYRVTGSGIYRDSVLLGRTTPLDHPLLNADVVGCDSVMAAAYRGKIHWFWGDTSRPHYPIGGNFHVTGATSRLPSDGGLDPATGIRFDYFTDAQGGPRPMAQMPGDGPTWLSALTVLTDTENQQRMYAGFVKIRNRLESYRWGFVVWNDKRKQFQQLVSFDRKPPVFPEPQTHTFLHREANGKTYVYFANPLPLTRVAADPAAFINPARYEGFTCLRAGTQPADKQLDRDSSGQLQYAWKANTPPLTQAHRSMLLEAGVMSRDETWPVLRDIGSGRRVQAHSGSVYWNEFRQRWVLIAVELEGESSLLGDVWFAEADTPTGPWAYARRILNHDEYSFYNPKHHPFFDQKDGRTIFFEGTYTHTFSATEQPTARYDYNQIMYRLDLSDARLNLPVAFYSQETDDGRAPFALRITTRKTGRDASFFALEQSGEQTVPVRWQEGKLRTGTSTDDCPPLFHAIPADKQSHSAKTVGLYEYVHLESGKTVYTIDANWSQPSYRRRVSPICQVWH